MRLVHRNKTYTRIAGSLATAPPLEIDPVSTKCSNAVIEQIEAIKATKIGVFEDCAKYLNTSTPFAITTSEQWQSFKTEHSCLQAFRIVQSVYDEIVPPCWIANNISTQTVAKMTMDTYGQQILNIPPTTTTPTTPPQTTIPGATLPPTTPAPTTLFIPSTNEHTRPIPTMIDNSTDDKSQYRYYFDAACSAPSQLYRILLVFLLLLA
ncbi:hypothetical protein THRCLA_20138 [Thraustotheca clavata]|uniref:Uncharacterized protein n=1 Tax=Thraustotheca clavata TaxID=74557 RepID=A0A1W0AB68_9STRA|nr:hypothetical protein THRCLA_20138 [Thraustotheca clavata]